METRITFGCRLQNVRKYIGDTQQELAEKLNTTIYSVRTWEQGKNSPSIETVADICRLYNVTADYLLGITDNDPLFIIGKEKLNPRFTAMLQRFEQFLLEEQKRNQKNSI